jgi:PPM family protein phosphatase
VSKTAGIHLHPIAFLSGIGKRENNEDAYYPKPGFFRSVSGLYMVCDGVGGHQKGEVASATLCKEASKYLSEHVKKGAAPGEALIVAAVHHAQEAFRKLESTDESLRGMSTTLTLAFVREKDILVAHCGDSRVYHFRKGKVIFHTEDHSLVNFLVQNGDIKPEDAADHPQRNVILRFVSGDQKPAEIDVKILPNIQPGDYILLCTDGILEAWKDEKELAALFNSTDKPELIVKAIERRCLEFSRDNYTCVCLQVAAGPGIGGIEKWKDLFKRIFFK